MPNIPIAPIGTWKINEVTTIAKIRRTQFSAA